MCADFHSPHNLGRGVGHLQTDPKGF
jgi:hypothetical protein